MRLRDHAFRICYGPADDRLHDFYIPALAASMHYDRTAGFFSSSALAVAAAGVARLIANGGTMRLLVGAELSQADVEAVQRGRALSDVVAARLLAALEGPVEQVMERRLEVLAWMIAAGRLEMRVVLPRGANGLPLPADQSADYFHAKSGIFTDASGDQIAFSGSVNESATGWQRNYEQFSVYFSWDATAAYLAQVRLLFERLWNDQEPYWVALDIPEAARQQLLRYRPDRAPARDPLERRLAAGSNGALVEKEIPFVAIDVHHERVLFQFLRDAPYLLDAHRLGAATAAIRPWPHQARTADAIVARFPERFLLCDEVGLGKTIEAGLALRQLILAGVVRRCLILAPKSVCRQWQEELYEKFALDVPVFDGERFLDVFGAEQMPAADNPWEGQDVFIASSQLAKRREQQDRLLAAPPWDLVLVDEAHHARRRDFLTDRYRPNRLLELLMGREGRPGLKERTRGMVLLTATPMQVHPVEVWDLLRTLGLGGRWGADEHHFLRFFEELRRPFDEVNWEFVFGLVRDDLAAGGQLDAELARRAEQTLGLVDWGRLRELLVAPKIGGSPLFSQGGGGTRAVAPLLESLSPEGRALAVEMCRRHTPLRRYLFRSTRRLLREYARQGLLQANVPERSPRPVWIRMTPDERALYERIEEYISGFYRKYEKERVGLGFVMTVYRRRLTSSFYAVRRSLERRLAYLQGRPEPGTLAGADEDDTEQDDLSADISETLDEGERLRYRDEIQYVADFLADLKRLGDHDSKVEQLIHDLEDLFRQRDTALVFTQYTDTMDFLRQQLCQVYGTQVACYSGRGGEVWNGISWVLTTKEAIKNAFRQGEQIKILLCTEAASEGLNLQTCGVLINYDMPWNPMRVEQRIGRIDRIGQLHQTVWLRHYFYEDTVEARVYRALEDRIGWFEDVVGELQPILLGKVEQAIREVALTPAAGREEALVRELTRLRTEMDAHQAQGFRLEEFTGDRQPLTAAASPVTLDDLERLLTAAPALRERFQLHPDFPRATPLPPDSMGTSRQQGTTATGDYRERAYRLRAGTDEMAVTFDAALFDSHPYSLRLLTYGSDLLQELLEAAPLPAVVPCFCKGEECPEGSVLRCRVEGPLTLCAYYALDAQGKPRRITHLADLETQSGGTWSEETIAAAQEDFRGEVAARLGQQEQVAAARRQGERLALEERARQTLLRAALVELAKGQQPDLFERETLPIAFTPEAVAGLKRHGYPFAALLRLVGAEEMRPIPTDPFYLQMQSRSRESLVAQFTELRQEAARLVTALVAATQPVSAEVTFPQICVQVM